MNRPRNRNSMTQIDVDVTLARELVCDQFPQWAELAIEPVATGGWDNRTFRLGSEFGLRFPSAEEYAAQVQKEQAWLPRIAPRVPLPIPAPIAVGGPGPGYPWSWSVMGWLEGEDARFASGVQAVQLARDLAGFLRALQRVDPLGGPAAGDHSFWRGGPLETYDAETRRALELLRAEIDSAAAQAIWTSALDVSWVGDPVWVHGDVAPGNLLVKEGALCGVIDFGCSAVGDPACDLVIAWTYFSGEGRRVFAEGLPLDRGTWARARGWALWKALITIAGIGGTDPNQVERAKLTLEEILDDPVRV